MVELDVQLPIAGFLEQPANGHASRPAIISEILFLIAKTSRHQNRFRNLRRLGGFGEDQGGAFEQAAEIFFAGVPVRAAGELEIGGGLVADFEALKLDDADIFRTAFPDLALPQFHG